MIYSMRYSVTFYVIPHGVKGRENMEEYVQEHAEEHMEEHIVEHMGI